MEATPVLRRVGRRGDAALPRGGGQLRDACHGA
jgi:hypothetical protein